jgi:hypothetical protein
VQERRDERGGTKEEGKDGEMGSSNAQDCRTEGPGLVLLSFNASSSKRASKLPHTHWDAGIGGEWAQRDEEKASEGIE